MDNNVIVLVALYRYMNFPVRIMHPLLEAIDGVKPYTIFFKNCQTNIFKPPTRKEEELFIKLITELNPKLVGFSVLSPYVPIAGRLTKLVKENSSSLVVWGGIHPTIYPEDSIKEADMICIGEGEGAIADLATHFRDRKPYNRINNLWINDGGQLIKNSMRPLIQDLDSIPFPSYGRDSYYFIDSDNISREEPMFSDNVLWVQGSRGCPYSCSYCVNSLLHPLFKNLGVYTRKRSVGNIIKEIKENTDNPSSRTDSVFFVDEVFGSEERWLDEFRIRYKKEIGMPFYAEYNPKIMNSSILAKLADAGIDTINCGIQTGSDSVRNGVFNRPGKNEEILKVAREVTGYGVKIKYDLIMDNPYETAQSMKDTIGFMLTLPKPLHVNLFSLQYFPGYPLTKKAVEDRHISPEEAAGDNLLKKTTKNWAYTARLFPHTKKQIFQNIIWLIVWGREKDNVIRFAVLGNSLGSRICLNYLNLKSVILSRMLGIGGVTEKTCQGRIAYLINGLKYLLKGDLKNLYFKIKKHMPHKGCLGGVR